MRIVKFSLLAGALLLLCAAPALAQTHLPPTFTPTSCWFDEPADYDVACGWVNVPETRADAKSPEIQLAVAVFYSNSRNPEADPIIYLDGGPGGSSIENLPDSIDNSFAPFLDLDRDFIFFDQRGIGVSQPALDCPELDELTLDLLDDALTDAEYLDLYFVELEACRERLTGEGINLAAYSTTESAADVRDIVTALGYEQVNLLGISYGTRLGLAVMRDYPEIVRSAVLDSVVPPQVDNIAEQPRMINRALETLFAGCAADDACNAAYPDLREVTYATARALEADPAMIELEFEDGSVEDALFDGQAFLDVIIQLLYVTDLIPNLPQFIYQVADGEYRVMEIILAIVLEDRSISQGMNYSVNCREETAYTTTEAISAVYDDIADLGEIRYRGDGTTPDGTFINICQAWNAGIGDPVENKAVYSDVPALVLAGEYDPVTPPEWAELAAETLSNHYYYEFPGTGHSVSTSQECGAQLVAEFIASPLEEPDSACLAAVGAPEWVIDERSTQPDGEPEEIVLVEFENDDLGIQGVVPDGWEDAGSGIYVRSSDGFDQTAIFQASAPIDPDDLLDNITDALEIDEIEELGSYTGEDNGFEWQLYRGAGQGYIFHFGISASDGLTFFVLMIVTEEEEDYLYNALFVPALDVLRPLD